jgi:hypothetical protein
MLKTCITNARIHILVNLLLLTLLVYNYYHYFYVILFYFSEVLATWLRTL